MYSVNIITKPFYESERQFVFCDPCFWSATRFLRSEEKRKDEGDRVILTQTCPICNNSVSLTPLEKNEAYRISSIGTSRGLEIQFSVKK